MPRPDPARVIVLTCAEAGRLHEIESLLRNASIHPWYGTSVVDGVHETPQDRLDHANLVATDAIARAKLAEEGYAILCDAAVRVRA